MILDMYLDWWLWAVLVVPPLGFVLWAWFWGPWRGRHSASARRAGIVVALALAALGPGLPQFRQVDVRVDAGFDVYFLVDSTGSMSAADVGGTEEAPLTRLQLAKADMLTIADAYPGARFALMTFDREAVLQMPLSGDRAALESAIMSIPIEMTLYSRGTSVAEAAGLLQRVIDQAEQVTPGRPRMVFYFGDGEHTSDVEPVQFRSDHIVDGAVFGYGSEVGGLLWENRGMFWKEGDPIEPLMVRNNGRDEQARTRIDEAMLQQVATQLGVGYQRRAAGQDVTLPPEPPTAATEASLSTVEVGVSLTWVAFLIAYLLLAWEFIERVAALPSGRRVSLARRGGAA